MEYCLDIYLCQVGGVRQVNKGARKSESDKTETKPAKVTPEDLEEFGEDKKEKSSTAIVSGAKTGKSTKQQSLTMISHCRFH